MSKIQEAIRKVQFNASKSRRDEIIQPSGLELPIGEVVNALSDDENQIGPADGEVVVVDRQRLQDAGYLAPSDQERFLADQYRLIKRPLLDNAMGRGAYRADDANLIMVTSPIAGDGKTFNCINLALSMAMEKDTSVVFVDADVAKRHVSQLFGVDDRPGLIDLLQDNDLDTADVLIPTSLLGLSLMPAGAHDDHATELLASRRMGRIVHELSKSFSDRIVIFDSPPMLVTSEARVLASFMGQIVLVVRAGRTPQQAVLQVIENLDDSKPTSVILNEIGTSLMAESYESFAYSYGYGGRDT